MLIKNSKDKLFAFWRYSSFPYLCGGEVVKLRNDGYVMTKEFGVGNYFRPIKFLPNDAGRSLLVKLKNLIIEHRKSEEKFNDGWQAEIDKLFLEHEIDSIPVT